MNIRISKYSKNPILISQIGEKNFEKSCVYNPAAVVKDGKVFLLYRAEEAYYNDYISRIGLATSEDGFNFERYEGNPVMSEEGTEEARGLEDPRVIQLQDGKFFMTYTAFAGFPDGERKFSLHGAFSEDLIHWEKIGRLVEGREKAGAIVQNYKHNGEYAMYFGEGQLKVAYSKDLKSWRVNKEPVLQTRDGHFDDYYVEGGPPPVVTDEGILIIYNSAKSAGEYGRKSDYISYAPSFAVFDKNDPEKLLFRADKPIMEPEEYWEKFGKVNYVIFATGLANFKNKWLLYYGGADKSIGVAELAIDLA
ncbi:MAG: hypothetical protein A2754_01825 [Candidatus Magasanikbacteria bacterium RIFCSPHIGHO2_01_FULL_47_8]|uniref:Glycosidase n=1 Tax=Candidatus Magasanikbacteria bacterium RIFCSPHIGHO2_01_FULL_47_8 TaxID=1798673 RepID=A0A1F6MDK0_9BACT|nr:MAG: hypothetical protein A2754_01825 [Candidatus Magasanikbacteria bacterium RIFCSPHIGHO2_01_FULL_47_8]